MKLLMSVCSFIQKSVPFKNPFKANPQFIYEVYEKWTGILLLE